MSEPVRVKITDPRHIHAMAEAAGMMGALQLLQDLPENLKATPGVALSIATIAAESNLMRGAVVGKNLATLAREGHNIAHYKSVHYDPNTAELICEFYEPDLFGEDPG